MAGAPGESWTKAKGQKWLYVDIAQIYVCMLPNMLVFGRGDSEEKGEDVKEPVERFTMTSEQNLRVHLRRTCCVTCLFFLCAAISCVAWGNFW